MWCARPQPARSSHRQLGVRRCTFVFVVTSHCVQQRWWPPMGLREAKDRLFGLSLRDFLIHVFFAWLVCILFHIIRHLLLEYQPISFHVIDAYLAYWQFFIVSVSVMAVISIVLDDDPFTNQYAW